MRGFLVYIWTAKLQLSKYFVRQVQPPVVVADNSEALVRPLYVNMVQPPTGEATTNPVVESFSEYNVIADPYGIENIISVHSEADN